MVILLDMDGVLVHNNQMFLDSLNKTFGTEFQKHHILDFHYSMFTPEQKSYMYNLWNQPWIYDKAELGQEEMKAINELRGLGRVVACTAPLEGHIQGKYRWLRQHFDKQDITICHDKNLIKGDVLVDDAIHNLDTFDGHTVCYTQPWNLNWIGSRVERFSQLPLVIKALTHNE